jgi:tRNA(Ile)-lysidine synthase
MQVLETRLVESWPPAAWADVTVLVAVSGGADSVALLRAMAAVKTAGAGRLAAAHFNHRLRPDADGDEQFVVDLCARLGVTCDVGHADPGELVAASDGVEAAARAVRYRFLQQTAGRLGARFVVTAHTADDQAETVLHRVLRGTGIRGLGGIARTRPLGHAVLMRPLLEVRHAELIAYLDALGQPWRQDQSNQETRFTRNRIRHRLLPHLQKRYNKEVVDALLRLGGLAREAQAVIDGEVEALFDRCVELDGGGRVRIALGPLGGQPHYLVRELMAAVWRRAAWPLQSMGSTQWEQLGQFAALTASSAKRVFPGGIVVQVGGGEMRLSRPVAETP